MGYASLLFFVVCAVPFLALMYYLVRKDKNKFKSSIGMLVLVLLVVAAVLAIVFLVKDFNFSVEEVNR